MIKDNPIQFAVTREDPNIEKCIIDQNQLSNILCIGSGGDTPISLKLFFGNKIKIQVLDFNPSQINLIKKKTQILSTTDNDTKKNTFNVENSLANGICQDGNFESLFRLFRKFIYEFCLDYRELKKFFKNKIQNKSQFLDSLFTSKYWPIAFELFFSDSLLQAMFGKDATQYAEKGSYPDYFRKVIEYGLKREDANSNYFLHHILLGHYIDSLDSLPDFLSKDTQGVDFDFKYFEGVIEQYDHLNQHDFIQLSNIFDWMSPEITDKVLSKLTSEMKPGAFLLIRKLNNQTDLKSKLRTNFIFHEGLENKLLSKDRSLFYSELIIAEKK